MTIQFITAPGGTELAVLPRADLETLIALAEERIDSVAADRAHAAHAAGHNEAFSASLVGKLAAGENPVRTLREYRGLSAADLAVRAGISRSYLSQIESGTREGTGSTLKRIASALDVDVDVLLWA
jgi:ribosome-binding protein aMBF1 (putative translation factor)